MSDLPTPDHPFFENTPPPLMSQVTCTAPITITLENVTGDCEPRSTLPASGFGLVGDLKVI